MKQANVSGSVELLDRDLAGKNLQGHWRLGLESNPPYPVTSVQPCLWKWADVHESFVRAAEVVSLEHVELLGAAPHRQARVRGVLFDRSRITRFVLAGRDVRLQPGADRAFREEFPVAPGIRSLRFEAEDAAGNVTGGEIALTLPAPGTPRTRQGRAVPPDLPR